jgi:hypothetical protein
MTVTILFYKNDQIVRSEICDNLFEADTLIEDNLRQELYDDARIIENDSIRRETKRDS